MKKSKALVLLSGGLDSMLAIKVLEAQGVLVEGLCFTSNFFNCDKAREASEILKIKLHTIDISKEMLGLVKNPPHGYGKNMNPCIDCHGYMFKRAGEFAQENNFDFIASGEVLGQRPFSQNRGSMEEVRKIFGFEVLRPLSAKLLDETEIEKNKLVKRHKLLDVEGRSRERQMSLAKKYKIKKYPSPSGGCLLTDPGISERLMKTLDYWSDCDTDDVELLKHGRVFWFKNTSPQPSLRTGEGDIGRILLLIGRHKEDNSILEILAKKSDLLIEMPDDIPGPVSLLRTKNKDLVFEDNNIELEIPKELKKSELKMSEDKNLDEIINIACLLTGWYSTKARGKKINFKLKSIN
jgi:predicted subunit of tRNA(5-methylaminomethyl-2-thiouridylate) methyltransferase